jgi:hypothetical protein
MILEPRYYIKFVYFNKQNPMSGLWAGGLGLFWVWGVAGGLKMGLNWVCLGLFFLGIAVFGVKTHKIGFVLHIFCFLVDAFPPKPIKPGY